VPAFRTAPTSRTCSLPSPNVGGAGARWRWLAAKERRELVASRAMLVFALCLGPLVGHAFATAVDVYGEASGAGGGPAALAQGLSPLDGIVVPTFGAYAIAAMLLFPFVAIRAVAAEKESGALTLLVQSRARLGTMMIVKFVVLLLAWVVAWVPGVVALAMWRASGGHLYGPEVATVFAGHLMRGALVIALGLAAAAVTDGAASAAVLTLAVTLGTWALDFIGQVRGGVAMSLARFTPDSAIRVFEHGELRLDLLLATLALIVALLAFAVAWLRPARSVRARLGLTTVIALVAALACVGSARVTTSWDRSEDRRSSFAAADETLLRTIHAPLYVTAHLAPEDPRLADLENGVLRKLRRTLPSVHVDYAARGATGLFEGSASHYGEVWYRLNGREAMTRSTTVPIVLETIYGLAGLTPPAGDAADAYPGYPHVAHIRLIAPLFYVLWPLAVLVFWWTRHRRRA
jgi:ABC-2 type transport system permease protein